MNNNKLALRKNLQIRLKNKGFNLSNHKMMYSKMQCYLIWLRRNMIGLSWVELIILIEFKRRMDWLLIILC